ncbi:MAG: hypothetical protein AMJ43_05180 [Coxiella sp. DG_40]|nr:MAG: hypothetical protein AMJ43_05180 [Coxiella sp. DG_40]
MMQHDQIQDDVTKQGKELKLINCKLSELSKILKNREQEKIYLIRVNKLIGSYWYIWAIDGDNELIQGSISELNTRFKDNTDFRQFYNWLKDFDSIDDVKSDQDFENQQIKLNEALNIIKYNKLREDYSMRVASKSEDPQSIKSDYLKTFAERISNDSLSNKEFYECLETLRKEHDKFLETNLSLDAFGQEGTGNLVHALILASGKEDPDRLSKLLEGSVQYTRVPAKFGNIGTSYPLRLALEHRRHGYAKTLVALDHSLVNDDYIVGKAQQDGEAWTKVSSASYQDHGSMLNGFVQRLYNQNYRENLNLKAVETTILAIHFLINNNADLDSPASLSTIQHQWLSTNAPKPEWLTTPLAKLDETQKRELREAQQHYSIPTICMLFEKVIESRDIKKQSINITNWIIELIEMMLAQKHDLIEKTYPTNHNKWPNKTMLRVTIEQKHVRLLGTLLRYSNWENVQYEITNCLSSITEARPIDREARKIAMQELLLKAYSNNRLFPKIPQEIEQFRDRNNDLDNMLNAMGALHSVFESGSTKIEEEVKSLASENNYTENDIYQLITNTQRTRPFLGFGSYKPKEGIREDSKIKNLRQNCNKTLDQIYGLLEGKIKQNLYSASSDYPHLLREMARSYFSQCDKSLNTGQRIIIEEVSRYLNENEQIDLDTLNPSPTAPLPSSETASTSVSPETLSPSPPPPLVIPPSTMQEEKTSPPPPVPPRNPTPTSTEDHQQHEESMESVPPSTDLETLQPNTPAAIAPPSPPPSDNPSPSPQPIEGEQQLPQPSVSTGPESSQSTAPVPPPLPPPLPDNTAKPFTPKSNQKGTPSSNTSAQRLNTESKTLFNALQAAVNRRRQSIEPCQPKAKEDPDDEKWSDNEGDKNPSSPGPSPN